MDYKRWSAVRRFYTNLAQGSEQSARALNMSRSGGHENVVADRRVDPDLFTAEDWEEVPTVLRVDPVELNNLKNRQ